MSWLDLCLDLLYPPRCAGCSRDLRHGATLCPACRLSLAEGRRDIEAPLPDGLTSLSSLGPYHGLLRRLITGLKFGGQRWLLPALVDELARIVPQAPGDALVAIPPSPASPLDDHLAFDLARALARRWHRPFHGRCLVKTRSTPPQRHLPRSRRRQNLQGAFRVVGNHELKGKRLILVDDVCTTGSTLVAVASALKAELSPMTLHGIVLSHAPLRLAG